MWKRLFTDEALLEAICRQYKIRRLSLFGSTLKGTSRPDSDVDLLVEFASDARPSLFTMAQIEFALSPLLGGRKVDLRSAGDLSRHFRDEVIRVAEVQFAAGLSHPPASHAGGAAGGTSVRCPTPSR